MPLRRRSGAGAARWPPSPPRHRGAIAASIARTQGVHGRPTHRFNTDASPSRREGGGGAYHGATDRFAGDEPHGRARRQLAAQLKEQLRAAEAMDPAERSAAARSASSPPRARRGGGERRGEAAAARSERNVSSESRLLSVLFLSRLGGHTDEREPGGGAGCPPPRSKARREPSRSSTWSHGAHRSRVPRRVHGRGLHPGRGSDRPRRPQLVPQGLEGHRAGPERCARHARDGQRGADLDSIVSAITYART